MLHWTKILLFAILTISFDIVKSQILDSLVRFHPKEIVTLDYLGQCLDMEGEWLAAGAPGDDYDTMGVSKSYRTGSVSMLKKDSNGSWNRTQKFFSPDEDSSAFGYQVDIEGDLMVVTDASARQKDSNNVPLDRSGFAYIYKLDNSGNWVHFQNLGVKYPHEKSFFGMSAQLYRDIIIIGAPYEAYDTLGLNPVFQSGAVYIFKKDLISGKFDLFQKIIAPDRNAQVHFGSSVKIEYNTLVIGSPTNHTDTNGMNHIYQTGAVYVYTPDLDGKWRFKQKITAKNRQQHGFFGNALSLDAGRLAIAALKEDYYNSQGIRTPRAGAVHILHQNSSGKWVEDQVISARKPTTDSEFGFSVVLNYEFLIVGSREDYLDEDDLNPMQGAGSVTIFREDTTSNDTFEFIRKVTAPKRFAHGRFGGMCVLHGEDGAIGAPGNFDVSVYTYSLICNTNPDTTINKKGFNELFAKNPAMYYQWLKCNGTEYTKIEGANERSFSPVKAGEYAVILKNNGCIDTSGCHKISTITPPGINEKQSSEYFNLYPNPFKNGINIESTLSENVDVLLQNYLGQTLMNSSLDLSNSRFLEFNVPPGMYVLIIRSSDKQYSFKLIKE